MPRKSNPTYITQDEPFPTALRELLFDTNTSQKQLADYVGCTRQAISLYATGQSTPDINAFSKIAEFFDVSYDYLLGKSKSKKQENVIISKRIGLNDDAIYELESNKNRPFYIETLNYLINEKTLISLLGQYLISSYIDKEIQKTDYNLIPRKIVTPYVNEVLFARIIEKLPLVKLDVEKYLCENKTLLNKLYLEYVSISAIQAECSFTKSKFEGNAPCIFNTDEENEAFAKEYNNEIFDCEKYQQKIDEYSRQKEEFEEQEIRKYKAIIKMFEYMELKEKEGVINGNDNEKK